jgi:hypothetical protein
MAIYPAGTSNDFQHIVGWKLTGTLENGSVIFEALKVGSYDIRVFEASTYVTSKSIEVTNEIPKASVQTTKKTYSVDEEIEVKFQHMSGNQKDWIGIYPAGSSNDWANMIQWAWIPGEVSGEKTFNALPKGSYEVRVFFDNSFKTEASSQFVIEQEDEVTEVQTTKKVYQNDEEITAMFENMSGDQQDWIAIYPAGSSNDWENMIQWAWIKGDKSGVSNFKPLSAGEYEIRVFFNNSFNLEAKHRFSVINKVGERVLYDDFEDGIDPRWTRYFGRDMTLLNVGVIDQAVKHTERQVVQNGQHSLRTYNSDGLAQSSGYIFNFENPNQKFKFLEVDMRVGESSHRFAFGVKIKTANGDRRIEFASWLNHTLPNGQQVIRGPYGSVLEGHREAFTQDGYLHVHPAPSDYFVGTTHEHRFNSVDPMPNSFIHYKIDIEQALKVLEPDNEFLGMLNFSTSGGDYDNLALSTH